jgi:Lon protease-like protein
MDARPRFGVFLVPNVVLCPHAKLELHVFETRYRALVEHALRGPRRFIVAAPCSDFAAVAADECESSHRVACVARILEHETLPDGRCNVVLRGESVVRIEEWIGGAAFRIAQVRHQEEEACFMEGPEGAERLRELEGLLESACPGILGTLRERCGTTDGTEAGLELLHTIAMQLPVDPARKLEWLACAGSLERWTAVRATLRSVALVRSQRQRTIERYSDLMPPDARSN